MSSEEQPTVKQKGQDAVLNPFEELNKRLDRHTLVLAKLQEQVDLTNDRIDHLTEEVRHHIRSSAEKEFNRRDPKS